MWLNDLKTCQLLIMAIAFYKLLIFKTQAILVLEELKTSRERDFFFFLSGREMGEWGLEVVVDHTVIPLYTFSKTTTTTKFLLCSI